MSQIVAFTRRYGYPVEEEITGAFKALIAQPERLEEMQHRQLSSKA